MEPNTIRGYRCICPPPPSASDPFDQKVRGGTDGFAEILSNPVMSQNISSAPQARFFSVFKANSPLEIAILWFKKCNFFAPAAGLN